MPARYDSQPDPLPGSSPKALLQARVDNDTKARFADLARRCGLSESDLLRDLVAQRLATEGLALAAPSRPVRKSGSKISLRLWADELAAVERLAKADARSIPAWVTATIRKASLNAIPFNPHELAELRNALVELGPMTRALAALAAQESAHVPSDVDLRQLHKRVKKLRSLVLELVDRASNRYAPSATDRPT